MRVAATVAADDRGVSVLRPVGGVPMVVRAVRCVLDAGVATHVVLDVPAPAADVLAACARAAGRACVGHTSVNERWTRTVRSCSCTTRGGR